PGSDGYSHVAAFSTLRDQATLTFSGGSRKPYGVTTTTFYNGTLACDNVGTTVGIFTSFPLQPALGFPSTDLISGPEGPLQPGNYSFRATSSGGWGYPP